MRFTTFLLSAAAAVADGAALLKIDGADIYGDSVGNVGIGAEGTNYDGQTTLTIHGTNYGRLDLNYYQDATASRVKGGSVWANADMMGVDAGSSPVVVYAGGDEAMRVAGKGHMTIGLPDTIRAAMPSPAAHSSLGYLQIGKWATIHSDKCAADGTCHLGTGATYGFNTYMSGSTGWASYRFADKSASRVLASDGYIALQVSKNCDSTASGGFGTADAEDQTRGCQTGDNIRQINPPAGASTLGFDTLLKAQADKIELNTAVEVKGGLNVKSPVSVSQEWTRGSNTVVIELAAGVKGGYGFHNEGDAHYDMYFWDDKVGIGTDTRPAHTLQVKKDVEDKWIALFANTHAIKPYGVKIEAGSGDGDYAFGIENRFDTKLFSVRGDGKVGIGQYAAFAEDGATAVHIAPGGDCRVRLQTVDTGDAAVQMANANGQVQWSAGYDDASGSGSFVIAAGDNLDDPVLQIATDRTTTVYGGAFRVCTGTKASQGTCTDLGPTAVGRRTEEENDASHAAMSSLQAKVDALEAEKGVTSRLQSKVEALEAQLQALVARLAPK